MIFSEFLRMVESDFLAEPDLAERELSESFFELNLNGARVRHELGLKVF